MSAEWFDVAGEVGDRMELAHWQCRECGTTLGASGKLLSAPHKFVATDVDGRPICLCFHCWSSPARRSIATESFIGTIREYHAHMATE